MDTMILTKNDGTSEEIELIMTFGLEKFDSNYVFYKIGNEYYAAKYIEKDGNTILDSNLSDDEKKVVDAFFEKLKKGGKL